MKIIDLSDWNTVNNWDIFFSECDGIIVKISEGRNLSDNYKMYIEKAMEYEKPWGVYCYTHAQTIERAENEATIICNEIKSMGYENVPLGIWIDIEAPEVITLDIETLTNIASSFISTCNGLGHTAGIYASLSTLIDCIDVPALADYVPYWVAQYNSYCSFYKYFEKEKRLKGWQFTDSHVINGQYYDISEWY